ncbi:MAG TPA: helix-turn-helix domain-containing protein [Cyclobacteriaceae bacterium]|nr:helix-turn-helix domain-containing protein [Cyclobacteriaceae bacterium]
MKVVIEVLHHSDFYEIRNFKCNCTRCSVSSPEYNDSFYFCFVRSGFFEYRIYKRDYDVHIGRVLISKPDYSYTTKHIDEQPDICSVFDFTKTFYEKIKDWYGKEASWFFGNKDIHSILLHTSPEIEYLHRCIMNKLLHLQQDNLLIDEMVVQLVDRIMRLLGNGTAPLPLSDNLRKYHLSTIEKATNYLLERFDKNISLQELADHCCVSLFHFSRIFKNIMQQSPYKYLSSVRLAHARTLLETTQLPVTQVAFECGYNSLEQFSNVYRQFFNSSPVHYRKNILANL